MPKNTPETKDNCSIADEEEALYLTIRDKINSALASTIKPGDTKAATVLSLYLMKKNALRATPVNSEHLEFDQKERLGITYIIKNINICLDSKNKRSAFITEEEKNQLHAFHKRFFSQEPSYSVSMGKSMLPTLLNPALEILQKQMRIVFIKNILGDQYEDIRCLCDKYYRLLNLKPSSVTPHDAEKLSSQSVRIVR